MFQAARAVGCVLGAWPATSLLDGSARLHRPTRARADAWLGTEKRS